MRPESISTTIAAVAVIAGGLGSSRTAAVILSLATWVEADAGATGLDRDLIDEAITRGAAVIVVADDRIDGLFRGLSFQRITGTAGDTDSLVQEIWRAFLIAMLLALVAEGLLSLPRAAAADRAAKTARPLEAAA